MFDLRVLPSDGLAYEDEYTTFLGPDNTRIEDVTSLKFNSMGDKLLVSYRYHHLYVFDTTTSQIYGTYEGHLAADGDTCCAWFGENFILCGSDCGHIYGWNINSQMVCSLKSSTDIVRTICVHRTLPILANAGYSDDIVIWEPTSDTLCSQIAQNAVDANRRELSRWLTEPLNDGFSSSERSRSSGYRYPDFDDYNSVHSSDLSNYSDRTWNS
jgi:WD40 repeat protein